MQKTSKPSSHVYDYVVIGSGITGLAIANALSRETTNVLLLESSDNFGGLNRPVSTAIGPMNNGLRLLPDTDLSHKAIAFLEMLLATNLQPQSVETTPLTYEAGGMKPFVGFGNNSPSFVDEINYFTTNHKLTLNLEIHEIAQKLFDGYAGDFTPRSYVTKFHIDDGKVTHITVNGQKTVHAHNFIYTGPVKSLKTLLPEALVTPKMLQKFSKETFWTAVCLDLIHNGKVTDSDAIHVLNGTTQDDIGPCAGQFYAATESNGETIQYSQWITFVADQEAEDTEVIGASLKKIKRQIKRAYPEALENLKFERILVVPSYSGNGDIKINANQTLPGAENLWMAAAQMNSQKNVLGALLQAEFVTSSLGVNPMGTQVRVAEETNQEETVASTPEAEL